MKTINRVIVALSIVLIGFFGNIGFVKADFLDRLFDKPLDKGGLLSIDKPLDGGGGLSIDKPFNKGGALSINRVYVPEKLRIGKVKSVAEVVIPVCWGSPQECRGMNSKNARQQRDSELKKVKGFPYYVTGVFKCREKETGKYSGRQCQITKAVATSCQDALDELMTHEKIFGDPCVKCTLDSYPAQYWGGGQINRIQGGLCRGW